MEIWKDIKGYEGYYQVSNTGKVRSNYGKTTHYLRPGLSGTGYLSVSLRKNCKGKTHNIHNLISKYFLPNPDNKPEINHKNGIKTDNRIENLEWVTRSENNSHAFKFGLKISNVPKGEANITSKLTNKQVRVIKWALKLNVPCIRLGEIFKVDRTTIDKIKQGKNWKHVII